MARTSDPRVPRDANPELVLSTGHWADVTLVAFLPDGRTIASAGYDRALILWDSSTGEMLRKTRIPDPDFWWECFSPDGTRIVGRSSSVSVLDVLSGELERAFNAHELSFSIEGSLLALEISTRKRGKVSVIDYASGEERHRFVTQPGSNPAIALGPDGNSLAYVDERDKCVGLMLKTVGKPDRVLPLTAEDLAKAGVEAGSMSFQNLLFSPCGCFVAGYGFDLGVVWNVKSCAPEFTVPNRVQSLAFSPDGSSLSMCSDDGTVSIYSTVDWRLLRQIAAHEGWARSAAFSPCGKRLATCGNDRAIRIWDVNSGELIRALGGHDLRVYSIAFAPDGRSLISGSSDGAVRLWDTRDCRLIAGSTDCGPVIQVCLSPSGDRLACLTRGSDEWQDGTLLLHDARTLNPLASRRAYGQFNSVAFASDDVALYSCCSEEVTAWDTVSGKNRYKVSSCGPIGVCRKLGLFASTSRKYGAGTIVEEVELRSVETGELVGIIHPKHGNGDDLDTVVSLVFSPDGTTLAIGSLDIGICLCSVSRRESFGFISTQMDCVWAIAFSPDGRKMAAGGEYDDVIRVYSTKTWREQRRLADHAGNVSSLAFSPDSKILASSSSDGTIKLWNPWNGKLLSTMVVLPSQGPEKASEEWLAYTPSGEFVGSENAERYIWSGVSRDFKERPPRPR